MRRHILAYGFHAMSALAFVLSIFDKNQSEGTLVAIWFLLVAIFWQRDAAKR